MSPPGRGQLSDGSALLQGFDHRFYILFISRDPQIEILGEPRLGILHDRIAADHEIPENTGPPGASRGGGPGMKNYWECTVVSYIL